jgi:putative Holliday junction resolvase
MARILCIDYGKKRTGIAVTDPFQIIATALDTIETKNLFDFLKKYFAAEQVELVLIGEPMNLDDTATHATAAVHAFIKKFTKDFPSLPIKTIDERFTSKMASQAMIEMGMKKKDRRIKGNVDQIAATIMLQEYLQSIKY